MLLTDTRKMVSVFIEIVDREFQKRLKPDSCVRLPTLVDHCVDMCRDEGACDEIQSKTCIFVQRFGHLWVASEASP